MFVITLHVGALLYIVFFHSSVQVNCLRCYGCDVASELGYDEAEKACNMQGAKDCPDPKHRACMTEAFTRDASFQVLKRCITECPVFLNSTAEHIRCCVQDACNDVMALDPTDRSHPPPPVPGLPGRDSSAGRHPSDDRMRPAGPPGPGSSQGGGAEPAAVLPPASGSQGGVGQKIDRMPPPSGTPPAGGGVPPGRVQKPPGRSDSEMNIRRGGLVKSGTDSSGGISTVRSTCQSIIVVLLVVIAPNI